MFEVCEDLSFTEKPLNNEIAVQTTLDQLDGDLSLVLFIGAHGQINYSHAAAAKLLLDSIWTYALTLYRVACYVVQDLYGIACGRHFDERASLLKSRDQRLDLRAHLRVIRARVGDKAGLRFVRKGERRLKYVLGFFPFLRRHGEC